MRNIPRPTAQLLDARLGCPPIHSALAEHEPSANSSCKTNNICNPRIFYAILPQFSYHMGLRLLGTQDLQIVTPIRWLVCMFQAYLELGNEPDMG